MSGGSLYKQGALWGVSEMVPTRIVGVVCGAMRIYSLSGPFVFPERSLLLTTEGSNVGGRESCSTFWVATLCEGVRQWVVWVLWSVGVFYRWFLLLDGI